MGCGGFYRFVWILSHAAHRNFQRSQGCFGLLYLSFPLSTLCFVKFIRECNTPAADVGVLHYRNENNDASPSLPLVEMHNHSRKCSLA